MVPVFAVVIFGAGQNKEFSKLDTVHYNSTSCLRNMYSITLIKQIQDPDILGGVQ